MNMYPSFTNLRSFIAYRFAVLRWQAQRGQLWAWMTGTESALAVFPGRESRPRFTASRKLVGIKDIRVADIVGTLNRDTDFDSQFRPLKKHNLDRWVNAYLLHEQDGWSPIIAHKVGEQYFIEDGHHRVSVARALGIEFIEAKVWEHAIQPMTLDLCEPAACLKKHTSKTYVTG